MTKHNFTSLSRRVKAAGFGTTFFSALMPDWWEASCATDPDVLPDVELRIARFLGAPLSIVRDPSAPLAAPGYAGAQLRRINSVDQNRLRPAIHAGLRIAQAVVRNLSNVAPYSGLPTDPLAWRAALTHNNAPVELAGLVANLWERGVPVVHVGTIPTPSFQGMAAVIEGRPAIVLGQNFDQPARVAFFVAHEAAHIAFGDCREEKPVVDEDQQVGDDDCIEQRADAFALQMLLGSEVPPQIQGGRPRDLAEQAYALEQATSADASTILWAWARNTGNYAIAQGAIAALYRDKGALAEVGRHLSAHISSDTASDVDLSLLRCATLGADE